MQSISKEYNKTIGFLVTDYDHDSLIKEYDEKESRLQDLLKKYNLFGLSKTEIREYNSIKSCLKELIPLIENSSKG